VKFRLLRDSERSIFSEFASQRCQLSFSTQSAVSRRSDGALLRHRDLAAAAEHGQGHGVRDARGRDRRGAGHLLGKRARGSTQGACAVTAAGRVRALAAGRGGVQPDRAEAKGRDAEAGAAGDGEPGFSLALSTSGRVEGQRGSRG